MKNHYISAAGESLSIGWSAYEVMDRRTYFLDMAKNYRLNANSVDPDQTPHSAVSDLDLHRLLMSLFQGCCNYNFSY